MDIEAVIHGLDALFANRQSEQVEDYLSKYLEQALKVGDVGSAITIINELIGYYRDTSQYDKMKPMRIVRNYCHLWNGRG